jgi:hypothetical protein
MPGGDGTGPMGAAPGEESVGGRWCRGIGAGFGLGRHGWRNVYHATGLPRWARQGRRGATWLLDGPDMEDEGRSLEWRAHQLEAELQRIRARLDELRGERAENS